MNDVTAQATFRLFRPSLRSAIIILAKTRVSFLHNTDVMSHTQAFQDLRKGTLKSFGAEEIYLRMHANTLF